MTGLVFAGTQQQVSRDVREQLPNLPPLVFVGGGQPHCAAMLIYPQRMTVKAACFATLQERVNTTAAW